MPKIISEIIPEIILASQSIPRRLLLEKLKIPFSMIVPDIDEQAKPHEKPIELVKRLSIEKSQAVIKKISQISQVSGITENNNNTQTRIIISSDQIAVFKNKIYGKPGDFNNAKTQLQLFNNNIIEFITGLCVTKYSASTSYNNSDTDYIYHHVISKVKLKNLTETQIENYLQKEQPYQCAASFKIEGLGISLVEKIETEDFNAIIGLPIIKLVNILEKFGVDIFSF